MIARYKTKHNSQKYTRMGIKMSIRQEKLRSDGENCKNLQKSSIAGSHIQNICLAPVEKNRRDFYNDFCPMPAEPVFYFSLNPPRKSQLVFYGKNSILR